MMVFVYEPELTPIDFSGIPALERYVAQGFKASTRVLSVEDALAGLDLVGHGNLNQAESLNALVDLLVRAYGEWNLSFPDGDGQVAPINAESMKRLNKGFLLGLVRGWIRGTVEVPDPLGSGSTGTGVVREGSIPMEISTPNLQS